MGLGKYFGRGSGEASRDDQKGGQPPPGGIDEARRVSSLPSGVFKAKNPAVEAKIDNPFGVVRGPDGAIWFTEYTGQRIRRVLPDGTIETMAGTGETGYEGDGKSAKRATFNLPHEIRFDAEGNYYITDMKNHAIRRVDAKTGKISTLAGTGVQDRGGSA